MNYPSRQFLIECFHYDPDTGIVKWKERPLHHFESREKMISWNRRFSGKHVGGVIKKNGRILQLSVHMNMEGVKRNLGLHRLILHMEGVDIPEGKMVDHINGDPTDNRRSNMRIVSNMQNCWNRRFQKSSNRSLPPGVRKEWNRYWAVLYHENKRRLLGSFATPDEAHKCYLAEAKKVRGEFFKEQVFQP